MRRMTVEQFSSNGALVVGGMRAILLQVADPVVGQGVAAHGDFVLRPMLRLRNTLTFVYAVMLGTPEQTRQVARHVDRVHAAVAGATDVDRQLWVAATLYQTAASVDGLLFGPLHPDDADDVYRAYARLGTALQVPSAAWPADRDAFDRYWDAAVDRLEVTDDARQVARDLMHPTSAAWWVRLAMPVIRAVTAGMLPRAVREAYGIVLHPRRTRAAIRVLRVLVRLTPRWVRAQPARHYLRSLPEGS